MKLRKTKFGFTLVEALIIMTITAILLAAATPLITRKVLNAPNKSIHGRYEAYYEGDKMHETMYYGRHKGKEKIIFDRDCDQVTGCVFEPPTNAQNFVVRAVGGGGAGGGAGDMFVKYWNQTNEDSEKLGLNFNIWKDGKNSDWGPKATPISVPGNPFPAPIVWATPDGLGTPSKKAELEKVPNWFNWDTLDSRKNPNAFNAVVTACSGGGGGGMGFSWSNNEDYPALRKELTTTTGPTVTSAGKCGCCGEACTSCKTYYKCTSSCKSSDTKYYKCPEVDAGKTYETYNCGGTPTCDPTPSRTTADYTYFRILGGKKSDGVPSNGNVIDPPKYGCAALQAYIDNNEMFYEHKLYDNFINTKVSADKFAKNGIDNYGLTYDFNAKQGFTPTKSVNRYILGGPSKGGFGTSGVVKLSKNGRTSDNTIIDNYLRARGGSYGAGACKQWRCQTALTPEGECPGDKWECLYDFTENGYLIGHFFPVNQTIKGVDTPYGSGPHGVNGRLDNGKNDNQANVVTYDASKFRCINNKGYNDCRTGVYNDEYKWIMSRVQKILAYGEAGQPGKVETLLIPEINGKVVIKQIGVGGKWTNNEWQKEDKADGPNGTDTIVGNLLVAAGGKGGKGAVKTDKYQLCSIDEKDKPSSSAPGGKVCTNTERKQDGGKGDLSELSKLKDLIISIALSSKEPGKAGSGIGSKSTTEFECNPRIVTNLKVSNGLASGYLTPGIEIFNNSKHLWNNSSYVNRTTPLNCTRKDNEYEEAASSTNADTFKEKFNGRNGAVVITW